MRVKWLLGGFLAATAQVCAAATQADPAPASQPSTEPPNASHAEGHKTQGQVVSGDYPARALRYEQSGTVAITVTVTPEGKATNCVVTKSSGNPLLDRAACENIEGKARFKPALDENGQPRASQYSTKITFRIK